MVKRRERPESSEPWRVGEHYGIHVYEGDRPVATFHNAEDAQAAVRAVNAWREWADWYAALQAAGRRGPQPSLPDDLERLAAWATGRSQDVPPDLKSTQARG